MLCELLSVPKAAYAAKFGDVKETDWFAPYVLALSEKGTIAGYNGMFEPQKPISRQDMAVMVQRALKERGESFEKSAVFSDEEQISDYAKEAVKALGGAEIINGYNNEFMPRSNATRAQAAAIMFNILTKYL